MCALVRETMDYFRALLLRDERSARALEVTQAVIELSAANYTAWHYRRTILHALHDGDAPTWLDERTFVTDVAREHPKNYQVWYHRRCVVEHLVALATASSEDLLSEELTATAEARARHLRSVFFRSPRRAGACPGREELSRVGA